MDALNYIFSVLQPFNILACFIGVTTGTLVGVLPGLGTTGAMALLLPLTFTMSPIPGLIMLAGIWYGSLYGGSTTSILINIPGEACSVVTTIDGYQMALKGRAGAALASAAIGSFIAGTISLILIQCFAPPLAEFALAFGSREYFAIALFGLVVLSNLTGKSQIKSFIMVILGIMLSTVGLDPVLGIERYTFDNLNLIDGFGFVPVVMGLFGVAEVLTFLSIEHTTTEKIIINVRHRDLYPTKEELRRSIPPMLRGTFVGFFLGLIPGPAATISSFLSYSLEKRISKHPEDFGKGAIEGVAGPEAANNASGAGGLIPLMSLGIPFAPPSAILLTGMIIHGITPGPMLISNHPEIFWSIVGSMYIGNVLLLILNLPLVGIWASVTKIKSEYLMPTILFIAIIGAYSGMYRMFDLWIMIIIGAVGYILKKYDFSPAALIIGLVLAPILEKNLIQSMVITSGDIYALWQRPITGVILTITIIIAILPILIKIFFRKEIKGFDPEE